MEETKKKGVYKIKYKKINQLYGVKVGDAIVKKQGTTWQCFQPCDLAGTITESRYHYCCIHCGFYIRGVNPKNIAGLNKLTLWAQHPKTCRGDSNVDDNVDENVDLLNLSEHFPATEKEIIPFVVEKIVLFICASKISFVKGVSKELTRMVHTCMDLARKFTDLPFDRIFPEWSRTTLSRKINEYGEKKAEKNLKMFVGRYVCIIWDAGKGFGFAFS
jgi:hypothetical protein